MQNIELLVVPDVFFGIITNQGVFNKIGMRKHWLEAIVAVVPVSLSDVRPYERGIFKCNVAPNARVNFWNKLKIEFIIPHVLSLKN